MGEALAKEMLKKIYFLSKIITIIFILFASGRLISPARGAWLDGWSRRVALTITRSLVGAQTDYQVRINITYDTDMQQDFDDIRFTSSNGTALLDYWIEVSTPSVSSTFWVEVSSIPASPDTITIYIYYGNPLVGSVSNGNNTFEVFDDCSGTYLLHIEAGKFKDTKKICVVK